MENGWYVVERESGQREVVRIVDGFIWFTGMDYPFENLADAKCKEICVLDLDKQVCTL